MARKRDPRRDQAFELFKDSNGEAKLADIAKELDVSPGTLRGWKTKDNWDQQLNGTLPKKKRNAPKKQTERSKKKNAASSQKSGPSEKQVNDVTKDMKLTPNQRRFVYEYMIDRNATQAAIRSGYSQKRASEIGYQLLRKTTVKQAIDSLEEDMLATVRISADELLEQYKKIAFADMRDVVTWGATEYIVDYEEEKDEDGKYTGRRPITGYRTEIKLIDSDQVDGTIIQEISQSEKGGDISHSIKLNDRMKALDKLWQYMQLNVNHEQKRMNEHKRSIDYINHELHLKKLELEIQKLEMEKERWGLQKQGISNDENSSKTHVEAVEEVFARRKARLKEKSRSVEE